MATYGQFYADYIGEDWGGREDCGDFDVSVPMPSTFVPPPSRRL